MSGTYAWTMTVGEDGATFLTAITATAPDPGTGHARGWHLIDPQARDRARAALIIALDGSRGEPVGLYRVGGAHSGSLHDLAMAVAIEARAGDPPWRGLLDEVMFVAALGPDARLRPGPPATITAAATRAAQLGFRYVVLAADPDQTHLDTVAGITIVTGTHLRQILNWLTHPATGQFTPARRSPTPARAPVIARLHPDHVSELRAILADFESIDPLTTDLIDAAEQRLSEFIRDNR